jgi:hypothetical protein
VSIGFYGEDLACAREEGKTPEHGAASAEWRKQGRAVGAPRLARFLSSRVDDCCHVGVDNAHARAGAIVSLRAIRVGDNPPLAFVHATGTSAA